MQEPFAPAAAPQTDADSVHSSEMQRQWKAGQAYAKVVPLGMAQDHSAHDVGGSSSGASGSDGSSGSRTQPQHISAMPYLGNNNKGHSKSPCKSVDIDAQPAVVRPAFLGLKPGSGSTSTGSSGKIAAGPEPHLKKMTRMLSSLSISKSRAKGMPLNARASAVDPRLIPLILV